MGDSAEGLSDLVPGLLIDADQDGSWILCRQDSHHALTPNNTHDLVDEVSSLPREVAEATQTSSNYCQLQGVCLSAATVAASQSSRVTDQWESDRHVTNSVGLPDEIADEHV